MPDFDAIRVRDAMHPGIFSCASDASLDEIAGIMATHRVHAVAIADPDGSRLAGVASDLDVVAAMTTCEQPTARQVAATEPLAVSSDERLDRAAQLMAEHGVAHLVVLDAAGGYPVGVLSTLDLAAVYAGDDGCGQALRPA
ncbi:MAG TPA: CBS domain-containing protein [Solirubrobacteraceae bacterium]|nr:CBS domain-containing protein [Solirubrobacteraceae bacterium]